MRHTLILLTLLAFMPTCTNATIILLHGSFSTHSRWYRPGGAFYEQLNAQAISKNESLKPFAWSGGMTERAIIDAAGELVAHLLTLEHSEALSLIAHSNGGNVSAYATMILAELRKELATDNKELATDDLELATDDLENNQKLRSVFVPSSLYQPFKKPYITKMREKKQVIPADIEQRITTLYTDLQSKFIRRSPAKLLKESFAIKELYLLGTPIDTNKFCVDMNIVEHAYNLYSRGDLVQSLVGKQQLPFHKRTSNVHVTIHKYHECEDCLDEAENIAEPIAPCHECIHHPTVGRWLLHLPTLVSKDTQSDTSTISDGELLLHSHSKPYFQSVDQE